MSEMTTADLRLRVLELGREIKRHEGRVRDAKRAQHMASTQLAGAYAEKDQAAIAKLRTDRESARTKRAHHKQIVGELTRAKRLMEEEITKRQGGNTSDLVRRARRVVDVVKAQTIVPREIHNATLALETELEKVA